MTSKWLIVDHSYHCFIYFYKRGLVHIEPKGWNIYMLDQLFSIAANRVPESFKIKTCIDWSFEYALELNSPINILIYNIFCNLLLILLGIYLLDIYGTKGERSRTNKKCKQWYIIYSHRIWYWEANIVCIHMVTRYIKFTQ